MLRAIPILIIVLGSSACPETAREQVDASASRPATDASQRPTPSPKDTGASKAKEQNPYARTMVQAEARLHSGYFEQAHELYEEAMRLRPKAISPVLGALRSLVDPKHESQRLALTKRIEAKIASYETGERTAGAAFVLGARLGIARGEFGEALDKARLAVQHLPELGVAWRVLGEAAMAAELWGDAVEALRRASTLGLKSAPGTWERLADSLDELGALKEAEEAAQRALELTGTDPNARRRRLTLRAVIEKHQGKLKQAATTLAEALALGPRDPVVHHNLGALAEARGDHENAGRHYEIAVEESNCPMTRWRLGHLQLKQDRNRDALVNFNRAATTMGRWTWPDSTRWWPTYEVAKILAKQGYYERAAGWFEDSLSETRTADATREVRSWLYFVRLQKKSDKRQEPSNSPKPAPRP